MFCVYCGKQVNESDSACPTCSRAVYRPEPYTHQRKEAALPSAGGYSSSASHTPHTSRPAARRPNVTGLPGENPPLPIMALAGLATLLIVLSLIITPFLGGDRANSVADESGAPIESSSGESGDGNETQPPSAGAESGSGETSNSDAVGAESSGTFWYSSYITRANREPSFVGVRFDGSNAIFYKDGEVTRTTYTRTDEPVDNNDANPYMSVDQSIKLTRIVFVPEDPSVWKLPVSDIVGLIELETSIGFGTEDYPNDPARGVIIGGIQLQVEEDVKAAAEEAGLDIDFPQIP